MVCKICKKENENPKTIHNSDNDCVLTFLSKIKDHYINFKSKLIHSEELAKQLQKTNVDLEEKVKELQNELNVTLKAKRRKTDFLSETELNVSEKFSDDLNIALNTERQLENSFSSPAQQQFFPNKIKVSPQDVKTPVKSLATKRKSLSVQKASKSKGNRDTSLSWRKNKIATDIEIESDSDEEHFQTAQTEDKKTSKLKSTSKKLVQSRLDFKIKKEDCNDADINSDDTFCEEVIGASPTKNSKTIRQITARQNCSTNKKLSNVRKCLLPQNICPAETQLISKKSIWKPAQTCDFDKNDNCDSSSVIILPTQAEEIISLNDNDTEGINMESAFLFHDILNEKENNFNYLQKLESDRIEQVQNRHRLHLNQGTRNLNKNNEALVATSTVKKSVPIPKKTPVKVDLSGISQIDCTDCQSYFQYLRRAMGGKLTNEEINERLRNCTKHNGPTDINPTPEGFWDPFIQSFAVNDPRNETLIDSRFRNRKT